MYQSLLVAFIVIIALNKSKALDCEVAHCETCKEDDNAVCVSCKPNFVLLNGTCPCRESSCSLCVSSYYGGCLKCKDGFEAFSASCNCKIFGCEYCNENGCDQCLQGFKLEDSQCTWVSASFITCDDPNCLYCNDARPGGCFQCDTNFSLQRGKCYQNPDCTKASITGACLECPSGFYPSSSYCEETCLGQTCTSDSCDNKCLICKNKELYQYANCHPKGYCNDINCENCISAENGDCFRCKIGFRLFEGKCDQCEDVNCLSCDYNSTLCSSCNEGYYLVNGTCISKKEEIAEGCIAANCAKCLTPDYCKECVDQYSMSNGRCIKCDVTNCRSCIEDNKCFTCNKRYVLQGGKCIETVCSMAHCLSCSDPKKCDECEEGYEIKYNQCQIKQCTEAHCSNCPNDIFSCSKCDYMYYLTEEGNCKQCAVENCFVCNKEKCLTCSDGYQLAGEGLCQIALKVNQVIPNCIFYNSNGLCGKCDSHCSLTGEGECGCVSISSIVVGVLFGVVLIAAVVVCFLFSKKRKELRSIQRQNELERENRQMEQRVLEMQKIPEAEVLQISEKDSEIPKCQLCNSEKGIIELSCRCLLCLEQGRHFLAEDSDDNKDDTKKEEGNDEKAGTTCPVCHKAVSSSKQLYSRCGICLEATTKPYHFNCNCAMKACPKCFNKCIDTKKCPGCRKDLVQRSARTNLQNTNVIHINRAIPSPGRQPTAVLDPNSQLPLQIVENQ